ncbi:transposase mutator type [Burkholderia sp. TJI49]|nr:transposase mutator type [Burkholderia sp. TJI49]
MYARGMSVREIQGFLAEHYGTEVSPDFINSVTDEANIYRTCQKQEACLFFHPTDHLANILLDDVRLLKQT